MSPSRRPSGARTSPRASAGAAVVLLAVVGLAAAGRRAPRGSPPQPEAASARTHRAADAGRPAESAAARALREGRPIDVNTASAQDLQLLPGIGPALSSRIVDSRRREGPFASAADLRRVRGIGPKTVARLTPLVTAGSAPPAGAEGPAGAPDASARSLARPPRIQ